MEVTENGFREIGVFDSEENAKAEIDAVVKAAQVVADQMGAPPPDPSMMTIRLADVYDFFTANPA